MSHELDCARVTSFNGHVTMGTSSGSAPALSTHHSACFIALQGEPDPTPLQEKLNNLAELIAKIGGIAGLMLFTALMVRFFVRLGTGDPAR